MSISDEAKAHIWIFAALAALAGAFFWSLSQSRKIPLVSPSGTAGNPYAPTRVQPIQAGASTLPIAVIPPADSILQ